MRGFGTIATSERLHTTVNAQLASVRELGHRLRDSPRPRCLVSQSDPGKRGHMKLNRSIYISLRSLNATKQACTRRQIFRPSLIISCIAISISVPPSIFSLKVDFVPEHPSVYHPSIPSPVGWAVMAEAWMLGYGKDRFCLCVVACNASSAG